MHSIGLTLRTLLLWAMIPLTLLGGTPIVSCVCANGEHKLLCQRKKSQVIEDLAAACTCCNPGARSLAVKKSTRTCCLHAGRTAKCDGPVATGRCCQSVTEIPNASLVAEKTVRHDQGILLFSLAAADASPRFSPRGAATVDSQGDLPPPDLVIVHHAFLI